MRVNNIKNSEINIDVAEALRYLGYKSKEVDEATTRSLNESISELQEISELKYVYRIFDINRLDNNISFQDKINIKSHDLANLFNNCDKAAVLATTIGFEVEKRIRYYSMTNLSKSIVFDACAAAYIEALCDYVEDEIKELAAKEGCSITYRYSPGYGDVPLSHQSEILATLNSGKLIGLTSLESSILVPRKSVTAFIGFSKTIKIYERSCLDCAFYDNCSFSREGGKPCAKYTK